MPETGRKVCGGGWVGGGGVETYFSVQLSFKLNNIIFCNGAQSMHSFKLS